MALIEKEKLIAEYDRIHVGPPGGARKLMEEAEEVPAITLEWIGEYLTWLESMDADVAWGDARAIKVMLAKWEMEQENAGGCSADACTIKFD
jgi:hypothetical protein